MAYAAPLGERTSELRGSPLRRLAGGLATVLGMAVCVGTLLVLLAIVVAVAVALLVWRPWEAPETALPASPSETAAAPSQTPAASETTQQPAARAST